MDRGRDVWHDVYHQKKRNELHGGRLETWLKIAFGLLAAGILIAKCAEMRGSREHQVVTAEKRAQIMRTADSIHEQYFTKRGGWSPKEVVVARNQILELQEELGPEGGREGTILDAYTRSIVGAAVDERQLAVERSQGVFDRMRADIAYRELLTAFDYGQPDLQRNSISGTTALGRLLMGGVKMYLLFVPFALAIFFVRLVRRKYAIQDEIIIGWRNLLFSALLWPIGLECYPSDTAMEIRRRRMEAEYRARVGKTGWNDRLTVDDWRKIEELVTAPRVELAARLAAIKDLPASVLWQARVAAYAAMVVGFILAAFSSAHAQSRAGNAEMARVEEVATTPAPPALTLHGYTHLELGVPRERLTLARVRLNAEAHPRPDTTLSLSTDLVGADGMPVLHDAYLSFAPSGSDFSIRAGQMVSRAVYMVPPPNGERLIGGPGASALMSFWDIGAEVAGQHGWFGWALEIMSGSGANQPDANADKDVVASVALGPFGPLRFALAVQAGQQPDGFRMRSAAHAQGEFGPVTLDILGTHQLLDGDQSWAASGMLGWRASPRFDLAAGYDEIRFADHPDEHVLRLQATAHFLDDHLRIGTAYRWSQSEGAAGLARLETNF